MTIYQEKHYSSSRGKIFFPTQDLIVSKAKVIFLNKNNRLHIDKIKTVSKGQGGS